ncbi:histone chaperone ASF1B-like [Quillaja saponaria]|uniref:Histone chaperone ASF1B-like n=1 Tax=Quillaja saponaria TaxID=32244 RepID=A0AAD7PXZ7_QUISA|nr:histone chaperone ASF1B-like [Quillaja saponaria]
MLTLVEFFLVLTLLPLTSGTYLEWKLIYVGSTEDETYDQLLESVLVGPVKETIFLYFRPTRPIKDSGRRYNWCHSASVDRLYLGQEFVRVGYYVNNDYDDEQLREKPNPKVLIDKVETFSDKPRVTEFPINFHPENSETGEQPPPPHHSSETNGNGDEAPSDVPES